VVSRNTPLGDTIRREDGRGGVGLLPSRFIVRHEIGAVASKSSRKPRMTKCSPGRVDS